jgi:hypothetical protein
LLHFVLLVLQWIFFFPFVPKKIKFKEEGQSLEVSYLWGQSSFKQCSFQSNSKILK